MAEDEHGQCWGHCPLTDEAGPHCKCPDADECEIWGDDRG